MNALRETGLEENAIVIYISDHGDWLGDHGLILKGPMHSEGPLRVPVIVLGPGGPAGKKVSEPVSTMDLAARFFWLRHRRTAARPARSKPAPADRRGCLARLCQK
jgi:arylsulfatase A-like enzyme